MTELETATITNWHAHIYYDDESRAHAEIGRASCRERV